MTKEEAIKIFNTVLFFGKCDCPKEEIEECLNMAIKALEQEPSVQPKQDWIPNNATNGDVIKAIFPDCERESRLNEECIEVMGAYRVVDRSWWNAPYKENKE